MSHHANHVRHVHHVYHVHVVGLSLALTMHWQPYKKLQNKWLRTNECKSWVLYLLVIEPGTSDNWSGRRAYFDLVLSLVTCGQYDLPRLEEFWPIFRWLAPNSRLGTLLRYNWWSGPDGHEVGGGQQDWDWMEPEQTKIIAWAYSWCCCCGQWC